MLVFCLCILFFLSIIAGACSPKPVAYTPPLEPLVTYSNEPALNTALKDAEPFLALRLAETYPQFASPRVRIILLETFVELGRYEEACALGEELLKMPDRPKKKSTNQKISVKNAKKTKKHSLKKADFPQYLTESQRHKVYFKLSLAYEGLNQPTKTLEYFKKTTERPNYYYLYRYAQNRIRAGDRDRALLLLKESYERSHGKFAYVNKAYARLLTQQAFAIYKENPLKAKENLALVLGDDRLKKCPAAARAEILWHQWF